jgi:hypothetical protein
MDAMLIFWATMIFDIDAQALPDSGQSWHQSNNDALETSERPDLQGCVGFFFAVQFSQS